MGTMVQFDLPLEQLRTWAADVYEPGYFDAFWSSTLADSRTTAPPATVVPAATRLRTVEALDVRFPGYGGHPIAAWLLRPRGIAERLPVIVTYGGYGAGRAFPHEHLLWSAAGYAQLVVDVRGQGANRWSTGDTPDPGNTSQPHVPGVRDIRHRIGSDLLLPAGLRRCGAGNRLRADPARPRCRGGVRGRWQPRRRHRPRRGRTDAGPCAACCATCLSCATSDGPARSTTSLPSTSWPGTAPHAGPTSRRRSPPWVFSTA